METRSKSKLRSKALLSFAFWFFAGVFLVFFALNRHSRADRFNYHSELWADKAGYSIYLQAFEYAYDGRKIPDTAIVSKSGYGFQIDQESGVIVTKYTYGTALAQAPFYILGRFFESDAEVLPGFSVIQNRMVSVAGAVYLLLGLFFLYRFLRFYYDKKVVINTLLVLLFGTSLLYYGTMETGMSHIYSFALFSGFLLFIRQRSYFARERFWEFFVFGCLAGWMIVLRQSNLLFPLVYFFLDAGSVTQVKERIKRMFRIRNLFPAIAGVLLLIAPQIVYWNYAFDSMLAYSYGDEGFNWLNPKILKVFFDPYNGLFIYAPILLFAAIYGAVMIRRKVPNAWLIFATFGIMTYIFSCWWAWWFGCAFGARSYVEYLSLLSMAMAYGWKEILSGSKKALVGAGIVALFCCVYTTKMAFSTDGCFPGSKEWDWPAYANEVMSKVR
ncbi:MAG TPA: hypothetical protein DIW47_02525 [Bacteroidetes bacterium]|nr:hypothetical protein [Bacteroidota bacterium]